MGIDASHAPTNVPDVSTLTHGTFGSLSASMCVAPFAASPPYGPSFHVGSQNASQSRPAAASERNAARHPNTAATAASAGAMSIFATDADIVIIADGRPRFSRGCHEYTAVCTSGDEGPSSSPRNMRLSSRTVNVADITTGNIASDQPMASAESDQRSGIERLIAPAPRLPTMNKTKNALAIRPTCSS